MKKPLISLGLALALLTPLGANALEINQDTVNAAKQKLQDIMQKPEVKACRQKGSLQEKIACFKDLIEKSQNAGTQSGFVHNGAGIHSMKQAIEKAKNDPQFQVCKNKSDHQDKKQCIKELLKKYRENK